MKEKQINGIRVSSLIYGTGNARLTGREDDEALECLENAYQAGFRAFDTAHTYGSAEKNLGRWLEKSGHRGEITIIDKGCNPGQKGCDDIFSGDIIRTQIRQSLERLKTDFVDFYILHRDDETKPVDEIIETLNECQEKGQIRAFGGSNWSMRRVVEANEYAHQHGMNGFSVISPCYSLAVLENDPWGGSVTISGEKNAGYREWLIQNQMPVFNYSALGRGFLSGKYRASEKKPIEECLSWAPIAEYYSVENVQRLARAEQMAQQKECSVSQICLAWLLNQRLNLFPIVSPGSREHMEETVKAVERKLTDAECRWLLEGR